MSETDPQYLARIVAALGERFALSGIVIRRLDLSQWPGPRVRLAELTAKGLLWRRNDARGVTYTVTPTGAVAIAPFMRHRLGA